MLKLQKSNKVVVWNLLRLKNGDIIKQQEDWAKKEGL